MSSDSKNAASEGGEAQSLAGDSVTRRVLVTGASGFLGRAVVARLLETGWLVDAVTSTEAPVPGTRHEGLRWHQADLLDAAAVERLISNLDMSCLMHLAWAPNRGIYTSPENFRWVTASARLLEGFLENGGTRAVFAGSSAEYDWSSGICREGSTPLAGGGAYGAAKRALAELFHGICELHVESGNREVRGAWARIFFLFGPYEPEARLVAAVARALIEGGPVRCSEGSQIRDYLFVGDAADALVELLGSDLSGSVNVASGEGIRVRDLVLELAERIGGVDRIEWGAADENPFAVADVGRLEDELGWRPLIGLAEGLDRTINWWRERLKPGVARIGDR